MAVCVDRCGLRHVSTAKPMGQRTLHVSVHALHPADGLELARGRAPEQLVSPSCSAERRPHPHCLCASPYLCISLQLHWLEQQPPLVGAIVVDCELARHTPVEILGLRLTLLVEDDVRRLRHLPRAANAKVLDHAHIPAGGAVEDVRRQNLAAT